MSCWLGLAAAGLAVGGLGLGLAVACGLAVGVGDGFAHGLRFLSVLGFGGGEVDADALGLGRLDADGILGSARWPRSGSKGIQTSLRLSAWPSKAASAP